jgi:PAS domain S-box-containing protein
MEASMRPATVRRSRSLASYLAALNVLLAVPLFALAIVPTSIYFASERDRLQVAATVAREDMLSLIDRELTAKATLLRALASSRALEAGDLDRFDSRARELIGSEHFDIILRDRTGRQLVNTAVAKGTPLPERPDPAIGGEALRPNQLFISNLFLAQMSDRPLTAVVVPVVHDGQAPYTLMAILPAAYFSELLAQRGPPAPYYAVVAGRDGIIIASSRRSEDFIGRTLPGLHEITLSEGTWSGLNPLGVPVFRIHRRSALSGWIVSVAVPQAALSEPLDRSLSLILFLVSAVALVALGSGLLLSHKMTQIFRSLSIAARRTGDGHIVTVPRTSLREANEIGAALEQAARKLSEHARVLERTNEELENRVEERTRELRSAAEAYRSIVDTAMDAIVVGNEAGRITLFNKAAETIFGYSASEAIGQSIGILMPEPHRSAHDGYVERYRNSGRRMAAGRRPGLTGCHKDGSAIALDLSIAEWQDAQGRRHFTGILRDVRDRERQAEELQNAKEHAERARARAESASQAKSQFLASMSHEIRTPLNAISGFAQLLHQSGDSLMRDRQVRYTQSILDASDQLQNIIDDVLDMARIEAGQVKLNCETLDCLEVMTEVYRTIEVSARERGIVFTADTSANLPSIFADRGRLIQVLLNLASNAVKYNIDGGWVMLSAAPCDGKVRFFVRDTGRGIAPEHHDAVFEPFNRLGAEQGPVGGTGIGLAISRRLVHAMKGEIGFESVPGTGSTFWVDLPAAHDEAATQKAAAAMHDVATTGPAMPDNAAFKILYIEDKIANVELMRSIVEGMNDTRFIDAHTVQDGVGLAAEKPDLVITDIHLPDGTGFDVLQKLRHDPETAHIPVIALTADAMPTNLANMKRHGFDHIVTKPFKVPDLIQIVRTTLKAA